MFCRCYSLTNIDLSNFNSQNVESMFKMFYDCNSLVYINLSNFNTCKCKRMYHMCSGYNFLINKIIMNGHYIDIKEYQY